MIEKMMDPIFDYYIINCTIPSIVTIENRYQIDFCKPDYNIQKNCASDSGNPLFMSYSGGSPLKFNFCYFSVFMNALP